MDWFLSGRHLRHEIAKRMRQKIFGPSSSSSRKKIMGDWKRIVSENCEALLVIAVQTKTANWSYSKI